MRLPLPARRALTRARGARRRLDADVLLVQESTHAAIQQLVEKLGHGRGTRHRGGDEESVTEGAGRLAVTALRDGAVRDASFRPGEPSDTARDEPADAAAVAGAFDSDELRTAVGHDPRAERRLGQAEPPRQFRCSQLHTSPGHSFQKQAFRTWERWGRGTPGAAGVRHMLPTSGFRRSEGASRRHCTTRSSHRVLQLPVEHGWLPRPAQKTVEFDGGAPERRGREGLLHAKGVAARGCSSPRSPEWTTMASALEPLAPGRVPGVFAQPVGLHGAAKLGAAPAAELHHHRVAPRGHLRAEGRRFVEGSVRWAAHEAQ